MSDIAIKAEGLSKLYRLAELRREHKLRNVLGDIARAPNAANFYGCAIIGPRRNKVHQVHEVHPALFLRRGLLTSCWIGFARLAEVARASSISFDMNLDLMHTL
jgi:hypothetical protein